MKKMNFVQTATFLALIIGICEIHAEPFKSQDCLKRQFSQFFENLETAVSSQCSFDPKISVQFPTENNLKTTAEQFAVVVNRYLDIIVPKTKELGYANELAIAIVNLCSRINREKCKPYVKNIALLLGNKLQEIFGTLSGMDMKQFIAHCGNSDASTSSKPVASSTPAASSIPSN